MQATKYFNCLVLACLAVLAFYSTLTTACTCQPTHPQTSYCNADYAVLVRVRRKSTKLIADQNVYKVEIKKIYKATPESQNILRDSRLVTPSNSAACGIELSVGRLYVIAGQGSQLSVCNYVKEYQNMTMIERLGFGRLYKKSCGCVVKPCFGDRCENNLESASGCKWPLFDDCQTKYSLCMSAWKQRPEGPSKQCRWI